MAGGKSQGLIRHGSFACLMLCRGTHRRGAVGASGPGSSAATYCPTVSRKTGLDAMTAIGTGLTPFSHFPVEVYLCPQKSLIVVMADGNVFDMSLD